MQDRQHGAVSRGVQELVRVPARGQRPGFGLAVTDHATHQQAGVVERGTVRVDQLAALVDRAGSLGRNMTRNAAWKRELPEQPPQPLFVAADMRINLAVRPFQIGVSNQRRPAVTGADDVDHVQFIALDDAIEMNIQHIQAWRRAPMPEQSRLDVLAFQRLLQERIIKQVDLADGEVIGGAPVGVHLPQFFGGEGAVDGALARLLGLSSSFSGGGWGRHGSLLCHFSKSLR
jgi:hypothetical protein